MHRLNEIKTGILTVRDAEHEFAFGASDDSKLSATLTVQDPRFYRQIVAAGGIGAAEAYIRGYWDADDLMTAMRILARRTETMNAIERGLAKLTMPLRGAVNWFHRNTKAGSKRNIAAHYDISNAFYQLMLDDTMTYSSGVFPDAQASLRDASIEKYDRICRKLHLSPGDHVLEVGSGWGGFAEHAVRNYGCRITTTTISQQQFQYAKERFRSLGLQDRISLLQRDYRDLTGKYDKLVSIEMIEAVGAEFLPAFFGKCSDLLKPNGTMCLQAITIPDHRYDSYRKSVDFIQQYIFPGGFLPSVGAMASSVARRTDFRFFHLEDFGEHYARTLACWRENFWRRIKDVEQLGFDDRFIRTWNYYLCYCEAGFRERQIGVSQIVLTKPEARLTLDNSI